VILVTDDIETVEIDYGPDYCGLGKSIFKKRKAVFRTKDNRLITDIISSVGWDIKNHKCDVYVIKGHKVIIEGKYSVETMTGTLTIRKQNN